MSAGGHGRAAALFFGSGKANDWRRHLNAAQTQEIMRVHGEPMSAFGYDLPRCFLGNDPRSQAVGPATQSDSHLGTAVGTLTKTLCQEFEVDEETCMWDISVLLDDLTTWLWPAR